MTDVSFVALVVRMLVSLAVVLGLMVGAYWVIRRRQGFAPISVSRPRRARRPPGLPGATRSTRPTMPGLASFAGLAGGTASRATGNRRGLRVLGRVGVGRTTQVVAVQFAERVYLLAASDQAAPAVLAELDLAAWLAATEATEATDDLHDVRPVQRETIDSPALRPSGLLDSLREATTRRG